MHLESSHQFMGRRRGKEGERAAACDTGLRQQPDGSQQNSHHPLQLWEHCYLVQIQLKSMLAWQSLLQLLKRPAIQCKTPPKTWERAWKYIKSILQNPWEILWITRIPSSRCDLKMRPGVTKVLGSCSCESFQSDLQLKSPLCAV